MVAVAGMQWCIVDESSIGVLLDGIGLWCIVVLWLGIKWWCIVVAGMDIVALGSGIVVAGVGIVVVVVDDIEEAGVELYRRSID